MRRAIYLFAVLVVAFVLARFTGGSKTSHVSTDVETAEIILRPSHHIGTVSPYIYGASIEWTENGNRIFDPQASRIRPEIIEQLKPLNIPVWRFPGGILADYYHWRDGVGPRQQRPKRDNPMDGSTHENNFGTDEFIEFCRALNAEGLVTANMGTGSLDEVLAWQKYFSDNGFPIHYWEIGNEIYLAEPRKNASIPGNDERIYKTSAQYAAAFKEWAKALRAQDPQVQVGAIAGTFNTSKQNHDWFETLLAQDAADMDFIALHDSFAPLIFGSYNYRDEEKRRAAYEGMLSQPLLAGTDIHQVQQRAVSLRNPPPKIAITEHFPLFGGGGSTDQLQMVLDQSRTLASALYTAALFHAYMREHVSMATYNLAVSKWFGALLTDTDAGLVKTPTYYVFDLYRNHMTGELLESQVNTPNHSVHQVGMVKASNDVPDLDVVATVDAAGNINLAVMNRNLSQPVKTQLHIEGVAAGTALEIFTIAGSAPNAINGPALTDSTVPGSTNSIAIHQSTADAGMQAYTFPPASITMLKWSAPVATGADKHNVSKHKEAKQ